MRYHDLRLTMHLPRWSCFSLFYFVNDAFLSTVLAGDQRWVQVIPRNCWSSARSHLRHVWDCRRHCRLRIAQRVISPPDSVTSDIGPFILICVFAICWCFSSKISQKIRFLRHTVQQTDERAFRRTHLFLRCKNASKNGGSSSSRQE